MLSTYDGNLFPLSHLSPNSNVIGRYFQSKLTSKKAGELKGQVLILTTKATYEAQNVSTRACDAVFVWTYTSGFRCLNGLPISRSKFY